MTDDLGMSLFDVTFVVVDLETTGGSPAQDAITEIGALKLRGGEVLGRFETLVNPGVPIAPMITILTGITEAMLLPAPRIDTVLPSFLEFTRDAVVVGHNVRFDVAFLDAALAAHGAPRLGNRRVDTVALARRFVPDEVPNLRLQTLARHFHTSVAPVHRAYADAAATADVLHALLERAATFGVLGLDDLLAVPKMRVHSSAAKLALTARLPRAPGIYLFRDRRGRVLYVGRATNLRAHVRSYFTDHRRTVPQVLRELASIEHRVCTTALEAEVRELRLIHDLQPRFNRPGKTRPRATYVKLADECCPRLTVSRAPARHGACLGPFTTPAAARLAREAIEAAVPLRACGPTTVERALTVDPALVRDPLETRIRRLVADDRFEEAAATRDRLAAFEQAFARGRALQNLRRAARLVVATDTGPVEIRHGRVVLDDSESSGASEVDEMLAVARWLRRRAVEV